VLGLAILATASAFGSGKQEAPATTATQPKEPVTIRLWMGSWWEAALPGIVSRFEAEHQDIRVKAETLPIGGYNDKAIAAMLSPNTPDVLETHLTLHFPGYVNAGLLEPLQPRVDKSQVIKKENWFPANWTDGFIGGTLYAVSHRGGVSGLFYNAGLFRKAGLNPDKPPVARNPELLEAAKKLTSAAEGVYGYGLPASAKSDHIVADALTTIVAFGGDWADAGRTKSTLNSPAAVKAVTWWSELYTQHKVVPPSLFDNSFAEIGRLFGAGKVGMFMAGGYARDYVKDTATPDLDYRVSSEPVDGVSFGGGWGFSIPKNSTHKDAAFKFIEWFTRPDINPEIMIREPTIKAALNHPKWGGSPQWRPFMENASKSRVIVTVPVHKNTSEIMLVMTEALQNVLLKKAAPQEAMDAAAKRVDALLK